MHDGQVHALEPAIFQEMLTQGCLGDLKSSAFQLCGSPEAYVSDRVVSKVKRINFTSGTL